MFDIRGIFIFIRLRCDKIEKNIYWNKISPLEITICHDTATPIITTTVSFQVSLHQSFEENSNILWKKIVTSTFRAVRKPKFEFTFMYFMSSPESSKVEHTDGRRQAL